MLCHVNNLNYPVYVSNEKSGICTDFLLITEGNKSDHVYIKDFNRFMCSKTKETNRKHFFRCFLQCFSS